MRSAGSAGLTNVVATQGAAWKLPPDDAACNGVRLTVGPGRIGNPDAALRELARLIRPGGRLVVGELFGSHTPSTAVDGAQRHRGSVRLRRTVG